MSLKEYCTLDSEGYPTEVYLFDDEFTDREGNIVTLPIPEEYVLGWGDKSLYEPKYDFELKEWVEGKPLDYILDVHRASKDVELNKVCQDTILAGFFHIINGIEYWFSYDKEAQQNFTDAQTVLSDGLMSQIVWTVKEKGEYKRITITKEVMDELKIVILLHKTNNISRYRDELMPLVESALSIEEVEAITWDFKQGTLSSLGESQSSPIQSDSLTEENSVM